MRVSAFERRGSFIISYLPRQCYYKIRHGGYPWSSIIGGKLVVRLRKRACDDSTPESSATRKLSFRKWPAGSTSSPSLRITSGVPVTQEFLRIDSHKPTRREQPLQRRSG